MINIISTNRSANQSDLSEIFKPVSADLSVLEEKLIINLSGSNDTLNKITEYIIKSGGKRLRPAVTFLVAKALNNGLLASEHLHIGLALEMIHTATLIHDDVIDEAETRRNNKTIHKIWNDKIAIAAGDYLLAKALTQLVLPKNNMVIDIFAQVMGEICEGEIEQNSQNYKMITLEQYIEKSARKTAKLFVAGAQCAAIVTPGVNNCIINATKEFALNFGIAFQIIDDLLNFTSNQEEFGKPVGIDLQNGILTAPVIFALKEYENKGDDTLKKIIQNEIKDETEFNTALDLVLKSDGINQTKLLAGDYGNKAINSLATLPQNVYKNSLLDLTAFILERKF
jgi:all-trans-nonaprenyl-diphosphate synthase